jgi:hypothetical protein
VHHEIAPEANDPNHGQQSEYGKKWTTMNWHGTFPDLHRERRKQEEIRSAFDFLSMRFSSSPGEFHDDSDHQIDSSVQRYCLS